MDVRIGGGFNPTQSAYMGLNAGRYENSHMALNGLAANPRPRRHSPAVQGTIERRYGRFVVMQDLKESRAYDAYTPTMALAGGGLALMPGDAVFNLEARGDLVLGTVRDPGRLAAGLLAGGRRLVQPVDAVVGDTHVLGRRQPDARLAAGGQQLERVDADGRPDRHPLHLSVHLHRRGAVGQHLYGAVRARPDKALGYSMLLAPSPNSALELLAGGSIYASGYAVNRSGADLSAQATPFAPGLSGVRARRARWVCRWTCWRTVLTRWSEQGRRRRRRSGGARRHRRLEGG